MALLCTQHKLFNDGTAYLTYNFIVIIWSCTLYRYTMYGPEHYTCVSCMALYTVHIVDEWHCTLHRYILLGTVQIYIVLPCTLYSYCVAMHIVQIDNVQLYALYTNIMYGTAHYIGKYILVAIISRPGRSQKLLYKQLCH